MRVNVKRNATNGETLDAAHISDGIIKKKTKTNKTKQYNNNNNDKKTLIKATLVTTSLKEHFVEISQTTMFSGYFYWK